MIKFLRAHDYGCLLDVKVPLTPFHAFIGPNDSGKSTLLHALRTVVRFASGSFSQDPDHTWKPFDPLLPPKYPSFEPGTRPYDIMLGCGVEGGWYGVQTGQRDLEERISLDGHGDASGGGPYQGKTRAWDEPSHFFAPEFSSQQQVLRQLWRARLVRFDPDALRRPSGLIPETSSVGFIDDRGHGLPGVYFALRNRDDLGFATVIEGVRRHFPTVKSLRVKAVTTSELVLEAELFSGARVEASRMSEGLLYYLAFAALRHLDPVALLLVEEPENGLHPARVGEVVRILRAIVDETKTQVVMATHSPLVINEMQPEEVSIVTRDRETGTKVTPMRETANFEARSKVYALGELWLSYANGEDEAPLLKGGPRS